MRNTKSTLSRSVHMLFTGQFNVLWYLLDAQLRGIDLSGASAESLGLNPSEAGHYSNSGGPYLESVLQTLNITSENRIIDFGSGKGGPSFTMAKFPFAEVCGIELSAGLVAVAKRNAISLGMSKVHFECKNATDVTIDLDRFSHAYFFNPFCPEIFHHVYQNLVDSLKRNPRRFTVICKHPEGSIAQCFPESDTFRLATKIEFKLSHPFYIFTSVLSGVASVWTEEKSSIYAA